MFNAPRGRVFPIVLTTLVAALTTFPLHAQVPAAPPPPAKYKAVLRYDIVAGRDEHVMRYDALVDHLNKLGFVFNPPLDKLPETDREDPGKNQFTGTLPSENVMRVFANPHVASMLVIPEGLALPDDGATPVRVRLELAGGLPPARQHELVEQARAVLFEVGFREALGYDQRGFSKQPFTRLVGTIPSGSLATLLRDLRTYPYGWFAPGVRIEDVPAPLRSRHPVLIAEVLPPSDLVRPYMEDRDAVPPDDLAKLDQDLWRGFADTIKAGKTIGAPLQIEVLLAGSPAPKAAPSALPLFKAAPSLFIVGQVGNLVSALVDPGHLGALARLPEVILVRRPQPALGPVSPKVALPDARDEIFERTGLEELHKKGFKGSFKKGKKNEPVRVAVIDRDFRAWETLMKEGKLPPSTRLVDLTRQAHPDFVAAPEAGDPVTPGHGTQAALVVALAAPEVEILLVRIPGHSVHELIEVGRYFQGEAATPTILTLHDQLATLEKELLHQRALLLAERREIFDGFKDDTDERREFGYLGPAFGWLFSDRAWHHERMAHQEERERLFQERFDRFRRMLAEIVALRQAQIAVCALNWPTGYALGGSNAVVRWFNENAERGPIWFHAAGNTGGQAWSGLFSDADGNGVMEFASSKTPLKAGHWTHELAFLRWQPWGPETETPEAIPVRVSLQWREAHDADYYLNPSARRPEEVDPYARPQARVDILLLRQVDPEGKTVGADVFELVARNAAPAVRLEYQPGSAVYETSFSATLNPKDRYALRVLSPSASFWSLVEVEGRPVYLPLQRQNLRTTRPPFAPSLPDLDKRFELRPRIFIETLGPAAESGHMVFADYATDSGALGIPAEARGLWSVAAIDLRGKARPYSAMAAASAELGGGPALRAPDSLQPTAKGEGGAFGTSLAAPFAAGWAAAASSSEPFSRERLLTLLRPWRGKALGVK